MESVAPQDNIVVSLVFADPFDAGWNNLSRRRTTTDHMQSQVIIAE